MRSHKWLRAICATAVPAVAIMGGAAAAEPAPAARAHASHPDLHGMSISLAIQGGYASDEMIFAHTTKLLRLWGASVTAIDAGSTQIELAALENGQVDVAEMSPAAGISALEGGLPLKAIAVTGPKDDDVFVAQPSIKVVKQLAGKTIGVFGESGLNGLESQLVLGSAGLSMNDAHMIQGVGQSVRLADMLSGNMDAAPISLRSYEAYLKPKGFTLLYNFMTQQPKLVAHVLWVKPDWLAKHTNEALAVDEAVLDSYRWFDSSSEKAWVNELGQLVPGTIASQSRLVYNAFRQFDFYPKDYVMTLGTMAYNQALLRRSDQIQKMVPVREWADAKLDAQALAAVGTR